ncbi:putative F-box domain, leucine-rich repeat domain, L domain-containing protein [Medicago truncatula]|uniref:F-box protein n=1 Tax=Medicago truncatula TaxID=3880 RepID=G7I3S3_MEDTR|nr:F-box protein [Medicago truncatula]RHN78559.1 putative F-box domain, leucine-rich repeat domain, L domain-containing protein [Medicago truncatula]
MAATETCLDLPEELWEHILNCDNNTFKSLSMVSKQFLSITNRLRFSLKIIDQTIPFIPNLFQRFPNLTSLDLTYFSGVSTLQAIFTEISTFPSNIKSLNVSHRIAIPQNGFRDSSQRLQNLSKSFNCTIMTAIFKTDILFIADRFPLLEELNLDYHYYHGTKNNFVLNIDDQYLPLPKLRKINLSCDLDLFHRICAWKNSELAARGVGKMEKMGGVF